MTEQLDVKFVLEREHDVHTTWRLERADGRVFALVNYNNGLGWRLYERPSGRLLSVLGRNDLAAQAAALEIVGVLA